MSPGKRLQELRAGATLTEEDERAIAEVLQLLHKARPFVTRRTGPIGMSWLRMYDERMAGFDYSAMYAREHEARNALGGLT